MKKTIIFALTLLLLMGCRHNRAVSPRLVELDSLIAVAPDSAAVLLAAIPADSLTDPENRAYHALLLTQSKYKAYIPAYSLDTINLAVQQYSDGHDPEKQTRSILYKGCVFEELPQIDSAMYYYKAAEDLATQSGDTYHRGYALMRQAWLYQEQNSGESIHAINKYRQAIDLFNKSGAIDKQLACMLELSSLYYPIKPDSAQVFVEKVIQKAQSIADSASILTAMRINAQILLDLNKYKESKSLAMHVISLATDPADQFNSFLIASQAFSHMGQIDSAEFCLTCAEEPTSTRDSVVMYRAKAELMQAKGDMQNYIVYSEKAINMSGDILSRSLQQKLIDIEKDSQLHIAEADSKRAQHHSRFIAILAIVLFLLVGIAFAFWQKRKKLEAVSKQNEINKLYLELKEISQRSESLSQQNKELSQENEELQALAKKAQQTESDLSTDKDYADLENERLKEKQLSKSLEYIAGLLHTFIQQSHELKPSEFTEKFRKGFLETPNGGEVDFWYTLRVQADQVHGGAVEKLLAEHPDLNEKSIRVLCMSALGFSTEMMATCLQHKSDYIKTLKNRLKKKLDINCSIPEYLKQLGETR